ncbi:MAG: hypothetical protein M3352_01205 [Bacteroidota bacterium]|nr:hypothetical protein [Bacteroidota bacterium]
MKKILYVVGFLLAFAVTSFAQQDENNGAKVRERMREYLQKRLNLSNAEADRFGPLYMEYFTELRKTNNQYKGDRLVLQQKTADLRLRYRDQFKKVVGDKRSNDVFIYERDFVDEVRKIRQERLQGRSEGRPGNRKNFPLP